MRDVVAGVSIWVHEELGVGMDGDEGLEVAMILDEVHDILHFDSRVCGRSMVGLGAWVLTGTRACSEHAETWIEISWMNLITALASD